MFKKISCLGAVLILFFMLIPSRTVAADQDPSVCLHEIERVCVHLEERLEACLSERGNQLSDTCRDELKTAMSYMQDSSGPAACVPDVQRLCPGLKSTALGQCITEKQSQLSESCQKYLQAASQKQAGSNP